MVSAHTPSLWITIIETTGLLKPSTVRLISRHHQPDNNFEHMLPRCINAPQIIVNWLKMKHMEILIVLISWCVSVMVVIVSFQFMNDLLFSIALRMAATPEALISLARACLENPDTSPQNSTTIMKMWRHADAFRIGGPLWGENNTSHQWNPPTKC